MWKVIVTLIVIGIIVSAMPISAENVYEAWVARYDGPGNYDDVANAIVVDDSGNVYVTGSSWAGSMARDYTTIKYSSSGETLWVRRYNGAANDDDSPHALVLDQEGNLLVTGNSYEQPANPDFATVKYSPAGDVIWTRTYDGPGADIDIAYAMVIDDQDNVYVTGLSHGGGSLAYEIATIKYSPDGDQLWVRRFSLGPGGGDGSGRAIAVDKIGNIIVTGEIRNGLASLDFATIKYTSDGDTLWVRLYNGPGNDFHLDAPRDLTVDDSSNVYVTGISWGGSTNYDIATVKYSPAGDLLWVSRYDDPFNRDEDASEITVDSEGNVYVAGTSGSLSAWSEYVVIKYSPQGDILWERHYNAEPTLSATDRSTGIALDGTGNVFVTGATYSTLRSIDYGTLSYDRDGNLLWVRLYNYQQRSNEFANSMTLDTAGNVYVTGYSDLRGYGEFDYITIKYSPCTSANPRTGDLNNDEKLTLTDIVYQVNILFKSWLMPGPLCLVDSNGDGTHTLADVIYIFNYVFRKGSAPLISGSCCP